MTLIMTLDKIPVYTMTSTSIMIIFMAALRGNGRRTSPFASLAMGMVKNLSSFMDSK